MNKRTRFDKEHADLLLQRALSRDDAFLGTELLTSFLNGYPIENLRVLLESRDDHAFKAGAWIASELGDKAKPLLSVFIKLLAHPSRYVRFFLLDAVLLVATSEDGVAVARALELVDDSDSAVRWKALRFLANAKQSRLSAAIPHLRSIELADLTSWLIELGERSDRREQMLAALDHDNYFRRRFGVAAASRFAAYDRSVLEYALSSGDKDVRSFAESELCMMRA